MERNHGEPDRQAVGQSSPTRGDGIRGRTLGWFHATRADVRIGLVLVLAGMAVPQVLSGLDRSRARAAARYLAARMALGRSQAVARSSTVALRFSGETATVSFATYVDGNHNGVRSNDIESGIDTPLEPPASPLRPVSGRRHLVVFVRVERNPVVYPCRHGHARDALHSWARRQPVRHPGAWRDGAHARAAVRRGEPRVRRDALNGASQVTTARPARLTSRFHASVFAPVTR